MSSGVKILLWSLVAPIAATVVASPAALAVEAPFWKVAGKGLAAGETKSASIKNPAGKETVLHGIIGGTKIEIRCKKAAVGEGGIEGSSKGNAGKVYGFLEIAECKLFAKEGETFKEQASCEVGGIKSVKQAGGLWLEGKKTSGASKTIVVFAPKELTEGRSLIAEVAIKKLPAETCVFMGTYDLEGSFGAQASPANEEAKTAKWVFPATPVAAVWRPPSEESEKELGLKFSGSTASIQGEMEVELTSKASFGGGWEWPTSTWSFHSKAWFVEGTKLPGTKALAATAKVEESLVLSWLSSQFKIRCTGLTSEKSEIVATTTGKAAALFFEGCETIKPPAGCEISETSIPTEAVEAKLMQGSKSPEDKLIIKPQTKLLVASFFIVGRECGLEGKTPINGSFVVKAPTLQSELVEQEVIGQGSIENNSLEGEGSKFYVTGNATVKLK